MPTLAKMIKCPCIFIAMHMMYVCVCVFENSKRLSVSQTVWSARGESLSDLQGTQMVEGFHHLCLIIAQLPCRSESDSPPTDQTICRTLYLLLFSHTNITDVSIWTLYHFCQLLTSLCKCQYNRSLWHKRTSYTHLPKCEGLFFFFSALDVKKMWG